MKDPCGHSAEEELERGKCGGRETRDEPVAPSRRAGEAEAAWMARREAYERHPGGGIQRTW